MYRSVAVLVCLFAAQAISVRTKPRIVGGSETNIQAHPFQVSIRRNGNHICGGSIIRPNVILTAAHCVDEQSASTLSIRAGSSYRLRGGTIVQASGFKKHPKFKRSNLAYDLALIRLEQNLNYTSSIQPIGLNNRKLYATDRAVATGWGTVAESGSLSPVLKQTTFPIQSKKTCKRVWKTVVQSAFCAGRLRGGTDTCQGDSGGPIVVNGRLAGITSNGNGCGRNGYPGLYTRVNFLRKWINANA